MPGAALKLDQSDAVSPDTAAALDAHVDALSHHFDSVVVIGLTDHGDTVVANYRASGDVLPPAVDVLLDIARRLKFQLFGESDD